MDIQAKGIATTGRRAFDPIHALKPTMLHTDWTVINEDALAFTDELLAQFYSECRLRKRAEIAVYMGVLVANLYHADKHGRQLLYSRDTASNRAIIELIDWMVANNLIKTVIAPPDKEGGCTSWMFPTGEFRYKIAEIAVIIGLRKGAVYVELRDKPKKKGAKKPVLECNKNYALGQGVRLHNELVLKHRFTLYGERLVPFLKRVFNNGSYQLGGRFYGAIQSLPKADRENILLDNESTVEPDFHRHHPHIMYTLVGQQLEHDPYEVEDYSYKLIKQVSFSLMNAKSRKKFIANVNKSGDPKLIEAHRVHQAKMNYYNEGVRLFREGVIHEPPAVPEMQKRLKGFIKGMPEGINGEHLMQQIEKANEPIKHLFCTEDLGLKLQFIDSQITDRIIKQTAKRGIPIFPVHDSYICKVSDLAIVTEIMNEAYTYIVSKGRDKQFYAKIHK